MRVLTCVSSFSYLGPDLGPHWYIRSLSDSVFVPVTEEEKVRLAPKKKGATYLESKSEPVRASDPSCSILEPPYAP
jgi:hypothetical protein